MPRRKTLHIDLDKLENGRVILELLAEEELLDDYDLSTLKITIQEDYERKIKDPDAAIRNLENYLAINPNCCRVYNQYRYVTKQKLAKMLRVSRVTLDKWLEDNIIFPTALQGYGAPKLLEPHKILEQLKSQKE